ncbi:MAG: hypothetical protein ACT4PV_05840 [Planctomycetaceae bacterium]
MSGAFLQLLAAALCAAYGAAVALRPPPRWRVALPAILLYVVAGANVALLVALNGDGRLLPGRQLNPEIVRAWREAVRDAALPAPFLCLGAVLAHLLVWAPRPSRATLLAPLPATLGFLVLFALTDQEAERARPILVVRELGPTGSAFLSVAPKGEVGARLIVSAGGDDDALLSLLLVHDTEGAPPRPSLLWSKDGELVVVRSAHEPLLALRRGGGSTGWLPTAAADWPRDEGGAEAVEAIRRRSEARKAVTELVDRHGGFYAR